MPAEAMFTLLSTALSIPAFLNWNGFGNTRGQFFGDRLAPARLSPSAGKSQPASKTNLNEFSLFQRRIERRMKRRSQLVAHQDSHRTSQSRKAVFCALARVRV